MIGQRRLRRVNHPHTLPRPGRVLQHSIAALQGPPFCDVKGARIQDRTPPPPARRGGAWLTVTRMGCILQRVLVVGEQNHKVGRRLGLALRRRGRRGCHQRCEEQQYRHGGSLAGAPSGRHGCWLGQQGKAPMGCEDSKAWHDAHRGAAVSGGGSCTSGAGAACPGRWLDGAGPSRSRMPRSCTWGKAPALPSHPWEVPEAYYAPRTECGRLYLPLLTLTGQPLNPDPDQGMAWGHLGGPGTGPLRVRAPQ